MLLENFPHLWKWVTRADTGADMLRDLKDYWIISKSGYFDPIYYLENFPELREVITDPLFHFIRFGWKEGRNPSALFDTNGYLQVYHDVRLSGTNPLIHFLRAGMREGRNPLPIRKVLLVNRRIPLWMQNWGILTTGHTRFVAELLANTLGKHVRSAVILTEESDEYPLDYYIVICPHMYAKLPDKRKSFVFQMEQSTGHSWFTEEYLELLESFPVVFDYSLENINYLWKRGIRYPNVYYLPIGGIENYAKKINSDKKYDILFFGEHARSPRRTRILAEVERNYNLKTVHGVYGDEMNELIESSRLVLNIHYYPDSLLETTRIQHCLSLGTPVLSEGSKDQDQYSELKEAVTFFNQGDVNDLQTKLNKVLKNTTTHSVIEKSISSSSSRFKFMFERFLISEGLIGDEMVDNLEPFSFEKNSVVLSLPETIERRTSYLERAKNCTQIFDGIRRSPGWIGCGLSYKYLARSALEQNMEKLLIVEDDVEFFPDHAEKLEIINEYLERNAGRWDIFSGIIADLDQACKVLDVEKYKGITFVTLDKMLSMVFNIYSSSAIKKLSLWDPDNDSIENAIDGYLNSQHDMKIMTTLPFLVGHREEMFSTIWAFKNDQYRNSIKRSEALLAKKVDEYYARTNSGRSN